MKDRQVRTWESFHNVQAFFERHPPAEPARFRPARAMLKEGIDGVSKYATTQDVAPKMDSGEARLQKKQVENIRTSHMRHLVVIARTIDHRDDAAVLRAAFRLPKVSISITAFLAHCDAMIHSARLHKRVFVAEGMRTDFLTRFEAARDELAATRARRAKLANDRAGARAGIWVELRRARRAVDILDALLKASVEDPVIREEWRVAKRVRQRPGGPKKEK